MTVLGLLGILIGLGLLISFAFRGWSVLLLAHRESYREVVVVGIIGALLAPAVVIVLGSLVGSF
jgi:cell division protein FtsW (lipid II flippase)